MDYNTIVATIIEGTGRPDKETYINSMINPVVRFLAGLQDSFNDLSELVEAVDDTATILNLSLPADFRKMAYLRPLPFAKMLDPVTPDRTIVSGKELTNCYYIAGDTAIIRLRNGFQTATLARGYYLYPVTLGSAVVVGPPAIAISNWVTDTYSDLVIDICMAKVFRMTGDVTSAKNLEGGQFGIVARVENMKAQNSTGGTANIIGKNAIS